MYGLIMYSQLRLTADTDLYITVNEPNWLVYRLLFHVCVHIPTILTGVRFHSPKQILSIIFGQLTPTYIQNVMI